MDWMWGTHPTFLQGQKRARLSAKSAAFVQRRRTGMENMLPIQRKWSLLTELEMPPKQ